MAQTVNGQEGAPQPQPQKQYRPGQRQQERLMRQARRRRQRLVIMASLIAVVVVVLAGVGIWQFPRVAALFQPKPVTVPKHVSSACSIDTSDTSLYATTPAAGPTKPPTVKTAPNTLASGLQCLDLKVGTGPAAQIGSALSVQYTGWLASSGQKFDSSFDRHAQAFTVLLGQKQVIKGWEAGLIGVQAGSVRRLIIPAALAYGAQGQPQSKPPIAPGATLIFDVVVASVHSCAVATTTNVYTATPTAAPTTPVVGPVLPPVPTAAAAPPVVKDKPATVLDGLQCLDLKVGTGAPAQSGSKVSVEYTGWFAASNKKFDSSYDHGGQTFPVTLGQGQVIKGFDEGLIGVRVGGTRRLIIPAALAYGPQGQPPTIPPNAILIFDITVVAIQ